MVECHIVVVSVVVVVTVEAGQVAWPASPPAAAWAAIPRVKRPDALLNFMSVSLVEFPNHNNVKVNSTDEGMTGRSFSCLPLTT